MPRSKDDEIFDAAASLFKEKGFHATSMQAIADAVGMQKGSLYYHISSKEELLFRISYAAISAITEQLEAIAAAPLTPSEKLRAAVENHVETLCARLDLMTVFLKESHTLTAEQQAQILAYRRHYEELLRDILHQGIEAGELRPVDVGAVTNGLLGMLNWMHYWYRPDGRLTPEEIADVFADFALRGLLVD
ncbi:MAG: HTH-type transcriptional repressor KstR2 [Anaerolineales bacterium]|nr:HTH-type transcriptional repressor KstR2 [Anaerolineales bacterium]